MGREGSLGYAYLISKRMTVSNEAKSEIQAMNRAGPDCKRGIAES